jgi:sugar phosphate isomerase/epimerase
LNRREFLGTTTAALASGPFSFAASADAQPAPKNNSPAPQRKSLPIGVFNPPFRNLSLDQMLEKFSSLGIEAAEIGAGGYTGTPQCPVPELLANPAKAREWKQKFIDRNIPIMAITCHGNALHPDPAKAGAFAQQFREAIQLASMLEVPTVVGFSGCPGASPTDTVPNWIIYGWPDGAAPLEWQWNERVIPYWTETAKFARDHGIHRIALEMHPNFVVYNPRTLMRLRTAVGPEIGANCDLSHLFWQQCDAVQVIRFLAAEKALFHAHMKDTAFFPENVARYGVLNFAKSKNDHEGSEYFRAVGYGHGANLWKDVIAAYMDVGYDGMLSIENEDPILSGEVGVQRALATLKNVRGEILTNT